MFPTTEMVTDLAKKRRDYLWRRGGGILLLAGGAISSAYVAYQLPGMVHTGMYWYLDSMKQKATLSLCIDYPLLWTLIAIYAAIGIAGVLVARRSAKAVAIMQYVPPVAEQIAALPSSKILVRGAQKPRIGRGPGARCFCRGCGLRAGVAAAVGVTPTFCTCCACAARKRAEHVTMLCHFCGLLR